MSFTFGGTPSSSAAGAPSTTAPSSGGPFGGASTAGFSFGKSTTPATGGAPAQPGGSLFGGSGASTTAAKLGGLFGGASATNMASGSPTPSGLFSGTGGTAGGSCMFGNASKPTQPASGLFGGASATPPASSAAPASSLFGSAAGATGSSLAPPSGLFGNASLTPAKPTISMPSTTPAVSIDGSGDLQLLVGPDGPDQVLFTVCSRSLSRASPVFNSMLNGPWAEKRPEAGDWTVKLPEDSPQAFRVILSIIHCRFRDVPDTMDLALLHRVCVCVDKYDITEPLRPWAKAWCLSAESQSTGTTKDNALTAWIAWVLGNHSLLNKSATELLWKSARLVPPKARPLFGATTATLDRGVDEQHFVHLDSTGILDHITTIRLQTARSLVNYVHKFWYSLVRRDQLVGCKCPSYDAEHRPSADEMNVCNEAVVGSVTTALYRANLLPSSTPVVYENLILKDLEAAVKRIPKGIVVHDATSKDGSFRQTYHHKGCNPGPQFLVKVSGIMQSLPAVLTEVHRKHLKERAQKIGVSY